MRKAMMIFAAMLALFTGQAMAQRCLPGMSAVEVKANMADGFYTGNSRDCGYSFGMYYSVFKGGANTWSFGAEYLQTHKPYGEKGRIPVAEFIGEVGYNLHLVSDYSQTFHLYGGVSVLGGYETVNWATRCFPTDPRSMTAMPSYMVAHSHCKRIFISMTT